MSTQQDEVTILAQAVNRLSEDLAECTLERERYRRALVRIQQMEHRWAHDIAAKALNP